MDMTTHSAVGTVSSSPLLRSLVDLNVLDDEIAGIKTFCVCVRFGILEKTEEEFGRLDRPATLGGTECLDLRATTSATSVPPHGNCLLVLLDVLEIGDSALQLPAIDCLCRFTGVLERDAEVGSASPCRLLGRDRGCCVPDHCD